MGTTVRADTQSVSGSVRGVEHSEADAARDSRSSVDGPLGLSVRERNILSEMKEAMIRVSQQTEQLLSQNDVLWTRVLRLEEERSTSQAWQSAEEALDSVDQPGFVCVNSSSREGHREPQLGGDRGDRGSISYEQGYQQGYLAAKETLELASCQSVGQTEIGPSPSFGIVGGRAGDVPPANPFRTTYLACSTTPQGTPVPKEPHPENMYESLGWYSPPMAKVRPPDPPPPAPPNITIPAFPTPVPKVGERGGLTTTGLTPASLVPRGVGSGGVELPGLPEVSEGGRNPFAPGDRVFWQLPVLVDPGDESDPATRAADWLEVVAPLMSDLRVMSGIWWQRAVAESQC